jgi:5-formyltetrahydrofolate cyclo-ligase
MRKLGAGPDEGPLYRRVYHAVERLALDRPLSDESPLPPEPVLMARFHVSRGTLRRAIAELEEQKLLTRQAGRGTFVNPAARLRRVVWQRLAEVARPDSRFDLDFANFIPDFEGSDVCVRRIRKMPEYQRASILFVTPDNNLQEFRAAALADGKTLVASTYGIRRGFVVLEPGMSRADARLAATLDGMERLGRRLSLTELRRFRRIDAVISGSAAVTIEGVHFGKGHGYLDLEWGLLMELALVSDRTPVIVSVHECQVVDERVPRAPFDCTVDVIVTPKRMIRCRPVLPKPRGIYLERISAATLEQVPYLAELEPELAAVS